VKLQAKSQDIHRAVDSVKDCVAVLQQFREGDMFDKIFMQATELNNGEITMPRVTARQKNRSNVPANNALEYFKRAYFLPFIDTCLVQLDERFTRHAATACQLSVILPAFLNSGKFEDIVPAVELYSQFLPDGGLIPVQTEYMRWQQYWQRKPATVKRPDSVVEALRVAAELGTYPSISILLQIFATLPVTTATGERSFSALKYIKNYLLSTMGEERLNGLAHMYINRDITLNYEKVIDEFGKFNRRLSFV